MRAHAERDGLTVHAVSGTYVVHLGFNVSQERRKGLLGFAVHRTDHTEKEGYWISNLRCFAGWERDKVSWPTSEAPIQKFRWGDYTAKPSHEYSYQIYAVYGNPGALKLDLYVEVTIRTEDPSAITHPDGVSHQVYFSRSGAASQAYVRHFGQLNPDEVEGGAAFKWLSRGLLEGLLAFIARARDSKDELYVAIYEFNYPPILEQFKAAAKRGVRIKILYDAGTSKTGPLKENKNAIVKAGLTKYAKGRAGLKSYISHHKFIVLVQNGRPISVWTGSTNMSLNGIYAQLNVGHAIDDPVIAKSFLSLHQALWEDDPNRAATRVITQQLGPVLPFGATNHFIFSPRSNQEALDYYIDLMTKAESLIILTTPFGVDARIEAFLQSSSPTVIKFGLTGSKDMYGGQVERIDSIDGTRYTMPARIKSVLDKWQTEKFHYASHAYIHTKFLIIDPLSDNPTVVTGSANFSKASCISNDENMLVIKGQKSVVDVYLTEFLRMFEHYAFRHFVETSSGITKKLPLDTTDSWTDRYFKSNTERERDRIVFSGA